MKIIFLIFSIPWLFTACITSDIPSNTLFHANVETPIAHIPLFLSKSNDSKFNIIATGSTMQNSEYMGNSENYFKNKITDSIYFGNNFNLKIKNTFFGLSVDYKILNYLSLFGGTNLTNASNNLLFDYCFGIGLNLDTNYNTLRLDLGYSNQTSQINLHYFYKNEPFLWSPESYDTVKYSGKSINTIPFVSLTYNTKFKNWLINPYFQISYFAQNLYHLTINSNFWADKNYFVETKLQILFFNFGVIYKINENNNFVLGLKYIKTYRKDGRTDNLVKSSIFLPAIQYDLSL